MMRALIGLVGLSLGLACSAVAASGAVLERVAFGSCARQGSPQPVWQAVADYGPDLLVLGGDNVYADTTRESTFRAAYAQLAQEESFARLRDRVPLLATWDDHDYGGNDAGAAFPAREVSERVFLDFFEAPADDVRRERPGIYQAKRFGPEGRRVQIVLLDTRYFRSEVEKEDGRYRPRSDEAATMLGGAQWDWLQDVLARPADLRLVVSSTQVLPRPAESESWSTMPRERERLLGLLEKAGRAILLSGDRHFGEILRMPAHAPEGVGYPLYELTASGLNVAGQHWEDGNSFRFGDGPYGQDHFGGVRIDWDSGEVILEILSVDGEVVRQQNVSMARLRTGEENR